MSESSSFFPTTAEGWSTLVANAITIGTFVFGFVPVVRWAHRIRAETSTIRRRLRAQAGEVFYEYENLQNIQLINQPDDSKDGTLWNIQWSRLRSPVDETPRRGLATITSPHLLRILNDKAQRTRITASKSAIVIGTVRIGETGEKRTSLKVTRVVYVDGDGFWRKAALRALQIWAWVIGDPV